MTVTLHRVMTCTVEPGPSGKTEMTGPANTCFLPDGLTRGFVTFVDAYISDQPGGGALTLSRIGTCTVQVGSLGKTEMTGPSNYCLLADGSRGYVTFVEGYLSDQPYGSKIEETVNVSAEIFVGAALVACCILGWIAGAQR